jgi:hypothetical protein
MNTGWVNGAEVAQLYISVRQILHFYPICTLTAPFTTVPRDGRAATVPVAWIRQAIPGAGREKNGDLRAHPEGFVRVGRLYPALEK